MEVGMAACYGQIQDSDKNHHGFSPKSRAGLPTDNWKWNISGSMI